jgi:hypothetical protein
MQQDSKVLRVTFRLAWVAANPVSLQQPSRAASYPASVLTQGTFVGALGALESKEAITADAQRALAGGKSAEEEAGSAVARSRTANNNR